MGVLLFHSAPWAYLAAGAAPSSGALTPAIAVADGRDMSQMAQPLWLMLALSAVFCVGRALDAPSTQQARRRINASLQHFEILAENVTDVITRTNIDWRARIRLPGSFALWDTIPRSWSAGRRAPACTPTTPRGSRPP